MKRYAALIEKTRNGYSAHVPDLPGCVAAGDSRRGTIRLLRESIRLHIRGLVEDGLPVPDPACSAETVEV